MWYQRGVRFIAAAVVVALCAAACGQPPDPSPPTPAPEYGVAVDPARIERVRGELPHGYEVADLRGPAAPATLWGFGTGWTADPGRCAALGDPVGDPATTQGWSASGPGGIVYAAVAAAAPMDPGLAGACGQWTLSAGHTSGTVTLVAAPPVDRTATVGMATAATTVVEGGTETHSHADTFIAYLGDHVAFVTVVTDPGSPDPPLGRDFAAGLLAKTVASLRG